MSYNFIPTSKSGNLIYKSIVESKSFSGSGHERKKWMFCCSQSGSGKSFYTTNISTCMGKFKSGSLK